MKTEKSASPYSHLSACGLLTACGENLKDWALWSEFHSHYRRKIISYLLRAFRLSGGRTEEFANCGEDWVQEVFTKLVQHDGRVIRSFRGSSDLSAYAFIASIAATTVADQLKAQRTARRRARLFSLGHRDIGPQLPEPVVDPKVDALLELIDVERALQTEGDSKNPDRDLLIFKLHFLDGLTASEISSIPTFNLTTSGLEKVLGRIRRRIGRRDE